LQRFMDVSSLPASPKQNTRAADIFSKGAGWKPTNVV
jgi:hypothetical protein